MASADIRLMEWLRDAHAMEKQAETMLETLSERIENYPEMKARVMQHIEETREQMRGLEECIHRRGGDISTLKDFAGTFMAMSQGLGAAFGGDAIVKEAIAEDTFEHMEISSYNALIAAADAVGDRETRAVCERNLRQEEDMAQWIESHLASLTQQYLSREQPPGVTAQR